jgi:hypothetical protein
MVLTMGGLLSLSIGLLFYPQKILEKYKKNKKKQQKHKKTQNE